jgi:hypothetical protein
VSDAGYRLREKRCIVAKKSRKQTKKPAASKDRVVDITIPMEEETIVRPIGKVAIDVFVNALQKEIAEDGGICEDELRYCTTENGCFRYVFVDGPRGREVWVRQDE